METAIKTYLDNFAATDAVFAAKYANPSKSLNGCLDYVTSQAQRRALKQKVNGIYISDQEVYGWAVHYYDEPDVQPAAEGADDDDLPELVSVPKKKKSAPAAKPNAFALAAKAQADKAHAAQSVESESYQLSIEDIMRP
jgi:hypothetical protein